jgi:oligopeptide/dipeptide ABC transporter ATP-binding protein
VSQPLLSITGLSVDFPELGRTVKAVRGCNIEVGPGEIMGLVGESGSGKSVTAMACLGLVPPPGRVRGEIVLDGFQVVGRKESELTQVRGGLAAMIFQNPGKALNPFFTVGRQIADVLKCHRDIDNSAARELVLEAFGTVHLPDPVIVFEKYPHQLSGGQLQRAMIAMALSCNPTLLVADEPTTALDVTIQAQILELINELQEQLGMAVLLITHDLGVVAEQADEVAVMYAGKIVERAKPEIIFARPSHPYTIGLMNSVPGVTATKQRRLEAIPGIVPSPLNLPSGCRFRDRCAQAEDGCAEAQPELLEIEPGHWVSCLKVPAAAALALARG